MVVGIPTEYTHAKGLDPEVDAAIKAAIKTIESLGAS